MSRTTFQPRGSSSTTEDFSKKYSRTLKKYSKKLQVYMLTVYFGTPNMFITLWFGFDFGTHLPLGTLII
jgi:hypothetical protein